MDSFHRLSHAESSCALSPVSAEVALPAQESKRDYDEPKVRGYTLPDPLLFSNGQRVTSAALFQKRRAETVGLFETNMYGCFPGPCRVPGMR